MFLVEPRRQTAVSPVCVLAAIKARICFSVGRLLLQGVTFFVTVELQVLKVSLTAVSDGASLVYTSVKEMKNLDILYKYLVHRLYGFPFHCPAQVVERDAVFM